MSRTSVLTTVKRSYICELCGEQIPHDVVRVPHPRLQLGLAGALLAGLRHVRWRRLSGIGAGGMQHQTVNPCRRLGRVRASQFTPFSHSANHYVTEFHSHVANITSLERS